MKILTILSICLMWMGCLSAQQNLSALVPMPNYIETQEGKAFVVTEKTQIVITDASLQFEAEELQRVFKAQMGLELNIQTGGVKGKHIYLKAEGQNESLEHYQLQVQPKRIEISAESSKGVFYGIQTLAQLLLGDAENTAHNRIAPVVLEDSPRFAFRGFMLDVARHFLPVSDVKRFIDLMVRYKYNVLQLHLTDDQGYFNCIVD
jgi:hexosaminidase